MGLCIPKNQLNMTLGCILFINEPQCYFHQWRLSVWEWNMCVITMFLCPHAVELWAGLWVTHVPSWRPAFIFSPREFTGDTEILRLGGPEENLASSRSRASRSLRLNRDKHPNTENWHWKFPVWKTGQPLLAAELIIMQIYANKLCLECCWEAAFSC